MNTTDFPANFIDLVETAKKANDTVTSRLTVKMLEDVYPCPFERYQLIFWLKEYKKRSKPVSKAEQQKQLELELETLKGNVAVLKEFVSADIFDPEKVKEIILAI